MKRIIIHATNVTNKIQANKYFLLIFQRSGNIVLNKIRACFSYNLFCNVKLNTHRLKLFISNILFQFWVQVYTFLWNRKNCGIPIFLISQLDSLIV